MVERFVASPAKYDPYPLRDRALLELLYATGCRASEVSCLRRRDVHLEEGFCICHGKGDKERVVPLGRQAIAATADYLERERPALASRVKNAPDWLLLSGRGQ